MRRAVVTLLALVLSAAPALARDPVSGTLYSFFGGYRASPPPVGGNCQAIAAAIGPEATWYGTFSGKRLMSNNRYNAYGAEGCFESEAECRIWQQQAINYAFGPIQFTACRPGLRGRW